MPSALLLSVRFHDGRYHGAGDWPPSPARLFQALVAGTAQGSGIEQGERKALAWLEGLDPPEIAVPTARKGQPYKNYVPNNDLDAKGGDPTRIAEIRAPKQIRPRLFDASTPLVYLWRFEGDPEGHATTVVAIAERLYQLGRGVDMAWATAEILGEAEANKRLESYAGDIHRPARQGEGNLLACPMPGSLASLIDRHEKMGKRFWREGKGKMAQVLFTQPPKPRFRLVPYDSPVTRYLYDLRDLSAKAGFYSWPLTGVVDLVTAVREKAAKRLTTALPDKTALIDRVFGRVKDMTDADKASRIRITPLPSIGHPHAESSIRRVLLEIPPNCPLSVDDIGWSFSALALRDRIDPNTGEVLEDIRLIQADDWRMPAHYGIGRRDERSFRHWRSITPVVLPLGGARRSGHKPGRKRRREVEHAADAVKSALRHAGVDTPVECIKVQREPFAVNGTRAEEFGPGTRFSKHRLWHVEITFSTPCTGPVVLGDGRYLGLGLLAPVPNQPPRRVALYSFDPNTTRPAAARADVLAALRRALMALDRDQDRTGRVCLLFSGHEADGAPAGNGTHGHVFLAADTDEAGTRLSRLYVLRPDTVDRNAKLSIADKRRFERVTEALATLRAARHGVLRLGLLPGPPPDRLLMKSRVWASLTDYRPTRHPKKDEDIEAFLERDVRAECHRRGLPAPSKVEILEIRVGPRGGVGACIRLAFAFAVAGPILLGRDSHMGGGAFGVDN